MTLSGICIVHGQFVYLLRKDCSLQQRNCLMGSILSRSGVCFNTWWEFYVEGTPVTQIDNLIKKFAFLIKCSLTLFLTLIQIYAVIAHDNLQ